jgi:hypothetical protein
MPEKLKAAVSKILIAHNSIHWSATYSFWDSNFKRVRADIFLSFPSARMNMHNPLRGRA